MQVYKAYFKIIKSNITQLLIYVFIFLAFAIILGRVSTSPSDVNFETTKVDIAFINNDKDSKIVSNLKDYLSKNTNIEDIGTTKQDKQNALYFREVEYIVTIPKGFTDKILSGDKDVDIEKTQIPNSTSQVFVDNLINRYLNTVSRYTSTIDNISEKDLISNVNKDLSKTTKVEVETYKNDSIKNNNCNRYYNFLSYSILAVLIFGIGDVMMTFNKKDLKRRNLASAMSFSKMNFQMVLGNISFDIGSWVVMILASFIMYKTYMFTINGMLLLLNSLVFTFASLSVSLLISNFITSRDFMSAVANVIVLGTCFISGVFVPQQYLSKGVIAVAKFNPTYWYVKANDEIAVLVNYSNSNLMEILTNISIVMGFAIAVYALNLVIVKQKRISN